MCNPHKAFGQESWHMFEYHTAQKVNSPPTHASLALSEGEGDLRSECISNKYKIKANNSLFSD